VATKDGDFYQSAVCAEHPMAEGAHYVEMTFEKGIHGAYMGVVGQGFDAAGGGAAQMSGAMSAEGWMLSAGSGGLFHAGKCSKWEGQPHEIKARDVVGLLLDLGQRTLSVYLNGARRGMMVAPGMSTASLWRRWRVRCGGRWMCVAAARCASSASHCHLAWQRSEAPRTLAWRQLRHRVQGSLVSWLEIRS
jgi:hypothetical protein